MGEGVGVCEGVAEYSASPSQHGVRLQFTITRLQKVTLQERHSYLYIKSKATVIED